MLQHQKTFAFRLCLFFAAFALLAQPEVSEAQRSGGRGGFGGGGLLRMVGRESVQAELGLTDAQKERVAALAEDVRGNLSEMRPIFERLRSAQDDAERQDVRDEMRALMERRENEAQSALEPILSAEQLNRLRQIVLQSRGARGILQDDVAGDLGLSSGQKQNIEKLIEEYDGKMRELGRGAPGEEREGLRRESNEKILAELSESQRSAWQNKLGAPFEDNDEDRGNRRRDGRGRRRNGDDSSDSNSPDVARRWQRTDGDEERRGGDAPGASGDRVASFGTEVEAEGESGAPSETANASKSLTFNFRYAPWPEVLMLFADAADLTLDLNDTPPGTFSYYDTNRYTPVQALDVLNGYLLPKGYILIRRDHFLVCLKIGGGIPPNLIPGVSLEELNERGQNELLSIVLPLDGLDAEQAAKEIEALLGPQGTVSALTASNAVVVADIGSNLMRVVRLLGSVTAPSGPNVQTFRAYPLVNISAAEAEQIVRKLFDLSRSVQDVSSGRSDRREWFRSMFGRSRGGDSDDGDRRSRSATAPQTADSGTMQVASDARTNTLLVTASGKTLRIVDEVVRTIDVPQDGANGRVVADDRPHLRVYRVESADPREVTRTLNALIPDVVINEDGRSRRIHIFGTADVHREVEQLIRQLDGGAGGESVAVIPLRRLDVYSTTVTLRSLFSDQGSSGLTIEPDTAGRRLIARGSADQLMQLKTVLAQLGEDGSSSSSASSRQDGPIRSISLGGRDPHEFMRLLEQFWSAAGENPLRIVEPPEADDRLLKRQPLQPDRSESRQPPRDAASPAPTRSQRTDPEDGELGRQTPVATVSRSTPVTLAATADPFEVRNVDTKDHTSAVNARPADAVASVSSGLRAEVVPGQRSFDEADGDADSVEDPEDYDRGQPDGDRPARDRPADNSAATPANNESEKAAAPAADAKPPVAVSVEGGNLVFSSRDADALDRLEDLIGSLTKALPARTGWTVFYLRTADAAQTAMMLAQLMPDARVATDTTNIASTGLLARGLGSTDLSVPLRIIPDVRANSLFVSGPPANVRDVENMLEILDKSDLPESLRDRVPRFIPVNYANVGQVAQIVRDVYKDFLGNDQNTETPRRGSNGSFGSFLRASREDDNGRSNRPVEVRLTIGVDTRTNQLIVSASDALFREIEELVTSLDDAAFDAKQTVRVVQLGGANPIAVQQALGSLIPQVKVSTTGASSPPAGQAPNGAAPSSSSSNGRIEEQNGEGRDEARQYFEERYRERMRDRSRDRESDDGDSRERDGRSSDRERRSRRGRGDR